MCGFVGFIYNDPTRPIEHDIIGRMNDAIAHRGPDDDGIYAGRGIALGHRRLSVLDLSTAGHQPMMRPDESVVIAYNGEVYNYRSIREKKFAGQLERFRSNSDTEVLLNLGEFNSLDWLNELNGMFAFALWDANNSELLLCRDRLGIKPLYYYVGQDVIVFGSEIRALLLHPAVEPVLDETTIEEYLAFRTICGPETMFKGIRQVKPGHCLTIRQAGLEIHERQFWAAEGSEHSLDGYENASIEDTFEALFLDAVRHRLVSDVPVGSFNSGGVDSSLVTAMMRSLTEGELHTFSVGFEEAEFDESEYAKIVSSAIGTNHHAFMMTEAEYVRNFEKALTTLEYPLNHAHTVPLMLLSDYARQFVTVALTGEGSDELFAGYPRLKIPLIADRASAIPGTILRWLEKISHATKQRRLIKLLEIASDARSSILENSRFTPKSDLASLGMCVGEFSRRENAYAQIEGRYPTKLADVLRFDQVSYLPSLLDRLDKTSMAAALECRVPFLDYRLVEWSYTVPDKHKVEVFGGGKKVVKAVAEKWLPKQIVYREKVGFGTPIGIWFKNPKGLGRYLDSIRERGSLATQIFPQNAVENLVQQHLAGDADHAEILWGLINLEVWNNTFNTAGTKR